METELYRVDSLPVFQNRMYDSEVEALNCPRGDIRLVQNRRTGLIYNAAFRPELLEYDRNYQNEQALSPVFQQHLFEVSEIIRRLLGQEELVEVGCGKGYFLEMLHERGFGITGVDPAYEGGNPLIKRTRFQPSLGISARGIVLRHVLEHIADPARFLATLRDANAGRGLIYIEVPCFEWICTHRAWFDIFYEHVNYLRLGDLHRMFDRVVESGRIFGGQYIYVVAELATLADPVASDCDRVVMPSGFAEAISSPKAEAPSVSAVWGGASKGVIFSLFKMRAGEPIQWVIDINPAKQGKHIPATGLLVRSPQEAMSELPDGATIYVMNSNYMNEIQDMTNHRYEYVEVDNE